MIASYLRLQDRDNGCFWTSLTGPPFRSHHNRNHHDWSSFIWDSPKLKG